MNCELMFASTASISQNLTLEYSRAIHAKQRDIDSHALLDWKDTYHLNDGIYDARVFISGPNAITFSRRWTRIIVEVASLSTSSTKDSRVSLITLPNIFLQSKEHYYQKIHRISWVSMRLTFCCLEFSSFLPFVFVDIPSKTHRQNLPLLPLSALPRPLSIKKASK